MSVKLNSSCYLKLEINFTFKGSKNIFNFLTLVLHIFIFYAIIIESVRGMVLVVACRSPKPLG